MSATTSVHKGGTVCPQKFHLALIDGLRRAQGRLPDAAFAKRLGLRGRSGLVKIYEGGLTSPKRLFDALAIDESILDDICALYGRKLVPADCAEEESAAPPLVAALHKIIDAERDGIKKHTELLDMDPELAAAEKTIGGLRNRIRAYRAPTNVREEAIA